MLVDIAHLVRRPFFIGLPRVFCLDFNLNYYQIPGEHPGSTVTDRCMISISGKYDIISTANLILTTIVIVCRLLL